MTRTLGRRTGERKAEVLKLTAQAGKLVARSIGEAKRIVALGAGAGPWSWRASEAAPGRAPSAVHRAGHAGHRADQTAHAGEPIPDRLVSIFDPDARPIRKGKLGKPNEFGFVAQICEVTENTKPGARG